MKLRTRLIAALAVVLIAVAVLPASAQPRHAPVRVAPRSTVVVGVGVGYGYGYYRPYYYRPFYGYYDPFYGPWFYPYAAWQYPYYGYGGYDISSSLRLQVTPRNTEVFVDGYYAGTVDDFDGTFQRLRVEPGEHDLQLFLPGHRSVTQKIYLQPGNTFRVKHAMEPLAAGEQEPPRPVTTAPPPQQRQATGPVSRRDPRPLPSAPRDTAQAESGYGTLSLRVQPGNTSIRIDGERWEGPQGEDRLVVQLSAGRHVLNIQRDGYRDYMTEVTVHSGETATLNVALTRQ